MISCSTSSNNCLLLGLLVLRPPISSLLQSATTFITKCDSLQLFYYKVRQVLLQSTEGIKKCDNFITKCDRNYNIMCDDYYKGRQNKAVALCNKLEMDGRRTGKPKDKYHHRHCNKNNINDNDYYHYYYYYYYLLLLLQVVPVKVNYNYFTLYKTSNLNLKTIWSKRLAFSSFFGAANLYDEVTARRFPL